MLNRTAAAIVAVAVFGAGAGWWLGMHLRAPQPSIPVRTPLPQLSELPDLELASIDGPPRRFSDWHGRPVLINYWATWCPPCVAEMPVLDRFASTQGDTGVAVIGVALDDPDKVREYLQRVPVAYPNLLEEPGPDDSSMRLGNARAVLPFSVLADAKGRIVATHMGSFDEKGLRGWVEGALAP